MVGGRDPARDVVAADRVRAGGGLSRPSSPSGCWRLSRSTRGRRPRARRRRAASRAPRDDVSPHHVAPDHPRWTRPAGHHRGRRLLVVPDHDGRPAGRRPMRTGCAIRSNLYRRTPSRRAQRLPATRRRSSSSSAGGAGSRSRSSSRSGGRSCWHCSCGWRDRSRSSCSSPSRSRPRSTPGNIQIMLAAAIVIGFRYSASWAFVAADQGDAGHRAALVRDAAAVARPRHRARAPRR